MQAAAFDRDKRRAKPLGAGDVLVARRLIDFPFAADVCFERLDGKTIGLDRTIAAAFADQRIDEYPPVRIGKRADFPTTPVFGSVVAIAQSTPLENIAVSYADW